MIILASHGSMAEGTMSALKMIAGDVSSVAAYGLDTYETPDAIYEQVEKVIDANPEERYVICCDLKGGSVHNRLMGLCMRTNISIICGMNLALVLALVLVGDLSPETVKGILEEAKDNMEYYDTQSFINQNEEEGDLW